MISPVPLGDGIDNARAGTMIFDLLAWSDGKSKIMTDRPAALPTLIRLTAFGERLSSRDRSRSITCER